MSIGANIKRIRESNELTQEDFGKIAGVSSMAVSQWENGRAVPRMGAVERIAQYFGISKGEVIDEESILHSLPVTSGQRSTVPLLTIGRVHAGNLSDEEEVAEVVDIPASVLCHHPHAFALAVEGDCMDKVVPAGYHVLVDPDVEPHNGSVAVAELEPGRAVMRRWLKGQDTLVLSADSTTRYDDIVVTLDDAPVRVIGTVVWAQTAEEME
jgi:repressor LexA